MRRRSQSRLNRLAFVSYDPLGLVSGFPVSRNRFKAHIKEGQTNMDVSGIGQISGATPARAVSPTTSVSQPATTSHVAAPRDELEISSAGKMLDRLSETPEVRAERLAQIKEAIDNGAYDTDEKLEAALSKMFDSIGLDPGDE
jgi:anti-sigma28 factor (negative regulator of flagellin synthesis)